MFVLITVFLSLSVPLKDSRQFCTCSYLVLLLYTIHLPRLTRIAQNSEKFGLTRNSGCQGTRNLVPVCVPVKRISGHFAAFTLGHGCGFHHDFYPVLKIAIFRQSVCRKMTKLCRKRQTLVRNEKTLSEMTKLCRQIYP
jgi:hypothetical protein